jgi:hypothetical protein
MRKSHKILVGKPEGKIPRLRPIRRWGDNIKMDFGEIRLRGVQWILVAQGRNQWRALVNTVMDLGIPQKVENFLTS